MQWFAFYPGDFLLQKVRFMSTLAAGAYIKLICYAFLDGSCSLTTDSEQLQKAVGVTPAEWKAISAEVLKEWEKVEIDGKGTELQLPWLTREWKIAQEKVKAARESVSKRKDRQKSSQTG